MATRDEQQPEKRTLAKERAANNPYQSPTAELIEPVSPADPVRSPIFRWRIFPAIFMVLFALNLVTTTSTKLVMLHASWPDRFNEPAPLWLAWSGAVVGWGALVSAFVSAFLVMRGRWMPATCSAILSIAFAALPFLIGYLIFGN